MPFLSAAWANTVAQLLHASSGCSATFSVAVRQTPLLSPKAPNSDSRLLSKRLVCSHNYLDCHPAVCSSRRRADSKSPPLQYSVLRREWGKYRLKNALYDVATDSTQVKLLSVDEDNAYIPSSLRV